MDPCHLDEWNIHAGLPSLHRMAILRPSVRPQFLVPSFSPSFTPALLTRLTSAPNLSFTVIFLTRFMLNLRGVYLSDTTTYGSTTSTSRFGAPHSGIRFSSSVVGNMGAPLSFGSATLTSYSTTPTIHDRREEHNTSLETEWDLKDETLETSRDPLSAGLRKERLEDAFGLELQAGLPSPRSEAEVTT